MSCIFDMIVDIKAIYEYMRENNIWIYEKLKI